MVFAVRLLSESIVARVKNGVARFFNLIDWNVRAEGGNFPALLAITVVLP